MSLSLHAGTPARPHQNAAGCELSPSEPVTYKTPRLSRRQECNPRHVKRAVPEGSVKAAHGLYEALPMLCQDKRLGTLTKPLQRRLAVFYEQLILMTDYTTMTVRVPWGGRGKAYKEKDARPGLAEWMNVSRRTVANYLRTLMAWGYLGTVARGRSAEFVREKNAEGNELPVYVICIPKTHKNEVPAADDVDKICTPPAPLGVVPSNEKEFLTRTRGKKPEKGHGYAANPIKSAASGAVATTGADRKVTHWPIHATTKRRGQRWAAAAEIRKECFPLRPLSAKDLASVLRPWLKAGYTVDDLRHALDVRPDGTLWPHDGAPVTRQTQRLREWVRTRLSAWTVEGEPMTPPSRHKAAEQTRARAQARAEEERRQKKRAERQAGLFVPAISWRDRLALHAAATAQHAHA